MLRTTLLVATIQLEKRSSICALIESESWLTTALDSKASLYSMPLAVVLAQVLGLFCLSVSQWTMERNPSWVSPFTHRPKSQHPLWSPTIVCSLRTPCLSTLMLQSFLTMRLSMISVGALLTLSAQLIPTSTVLFLRSSHPSQPH
uniref:Uncharacterized protein n=1 Tax=Opuntia streptacantha TaxID=393608 RepID=A0A7C9CT26_OPUST